MAEAQVKKPGSKDGSNGLRKAAVFMLAIGEERAARIFASMDDFEIRDVSREMAAVGRIAGDEMERVLAEFVESVGGSGGVVGGWGTTERLLKSFMKEDRVREIMEEMRGPAGRTMWEKLANVGEDTLANYLKNEYPQTVAVIMSRITPPHAAKVLGQLPENLALEVMQRMMVMDNVPREVVDAVEESLRSEFMRSLATKNKRDAHAAMAEIFNNFDRASESKFMNMIAAYSQSDADRIRSLMFTFEDLMKADDKGFSEIVRQVEKDVMALSLKAASDDLKQRFFKNMSERAAKILQEDMSAMGPVRVKDVDEAQAKVVAIARKLSDEGKVVFAAEGGEEEFIS